MNNYTARVGMSEESFLELCDEVGIDPSTISDLLRDRLDCLYQYPQSQWSLLKGIHEERMCGA